MEWWQFVVIALVLGAGAYWYVFVPHITPKKCSSCPGKKDGL